MIKTTAARTTARFDLGTVILAREKLLMPEYNKKKKVYRYKKDRKKGMQVRKQEKEG